MKKIVVRIDPPLLHDNSGIVHTGTSWQVSKLPDFTLRDYLVIESINDTVSLLEYRANLDMDNTDNLFVRTKYHFNNNQESGWSRIIPFKGDQVGFKLSATIVATPKINYLLDFENNENGSLILQTSDLKLFSGIGLHKSTSWFLYDIDGKLIYERQKDEDNLTELILDLDIIESNKAHIVKVIHHTNTNSDSNSGKLILTNLVSDTALFNLECPYQLVPNRWTYFALTLFTNKFKSIDITIVDEFNNEVASNPNQNTRTPRIYSGALRPYHKYTVLAKINLVTGESTNKKVILTTITKPNTLIDFKYDIEYSEKQTFKQELLLGGTTVQNSTELFTGVILLNKNNDKNVYGYKFVNDKLQEVGNLLTLENEDVPFDIPYVNTVQLNNGRVLIDYSLDSNDEIFRKSVFKLFDYNTITHKLTEIKTTIRENERWSTAISNSLVPMDNNNVYYVPAVEKINNVEQTLKFKMLNTETFTITTIGDLPIPAIRNVSLVKLDSDRIMLVGGSYGAVGEFKDETYVRDNNDIYVYSISENSWVKIATFPNTVPNGIYGFQLVMRRDGKVAMFNSVDTGNTVGNQHVIVFNPNTFTFTINTQDTDDSLRYRNTIQMLNGDVLRISSRVLDPQKLYNYYTIKFVPTADVDNSVIDVITDLVVKPGEIVTIESPYRYTSITIQGTSYEDTGILNWIDGDKVKTFMYKDLLITRDTEIVQDLSLPINTYNSITVLEDVNFTVRTI